MRQENNILSITTKALKGFCNVSIKVLNKSAPWKKMFAADDKISFMKEDLSKEITKR